MNARTQRLDVAVEGHQVEEALHALFHALLLHRSTGKFHYKNGGKYSIGTIGLEDVDCERIDMTYVRITSKDLQNKIDTDLRGFCNALRDREMNNFGEPVSGQIDLQFYQKKKVPWPFTPECTPWEVWSINVNIVSLANEHERQLFSQELIESMSAKMLTIAEAMNNHDQFTPKVPSQQELECVYDTSFHDIQPFLFKISYQLNDDTRDSQATVGATMKKIIKGTLALG